MREHPDKVLPRLHFLLLEFRADVLERNERIVMLAKLVFRGMDGELEHLTFPV